MIIVVYAFLIVSVEFLVSKNQHIKKSNELHVSAKCKWSIHNEL